MAILFTTLLLWLQAAQPVGIVTGKVVLPTGMPAAGIRVYAMSVRDAKDAGSATVIESLSQTDEMGRYRLEVPAGRYYIAAGSVEAPTYFPGTGDVGAARILSVAAGSVTDAVDFSRFVPASRTFAGIIPSPALPPGSTGALSGVVRY